MANISDIPGIEAKLATIQDPILKQTATEAARVALAQAQAYVNQQASIITELAKYRKKIDDDTGCFCFAENPWYNRKGSIVLLTNLHYTIEKCRNSFWDNSPDHQNEVPADQLSSVE